MVRLITYEDGVHGLMIAAGTPGLREAESVFDARGLEPTGYAWQALAECLVRGTAAGPISFDPEADMFVARSADRQAIEELADALGGLIADPVALDAAITEASESSDGELG